MFKFIKNLFISKKEGTFLNGYKSPAKKQNDCFPLSLEDLVSNYNDIIKKDEEVKITLETRKKNKENVANVLSKYIRYMLGDLVKDIVIDSRNYDSNDNTDVTSILITMHDEYKESITIFAFEHDGGIRMLEYVNNLILKYKLKNNHNMTLEQYESQLKEIKSAVGL